MGTHCTSESLGRVACKGGILFILFHRNHCSGKSTEATFGQAPWFAGSCEQQASVQPGVQSLTCVCRADAALAPGMGFQASFPFQLPLPYLGNWPGSFRWPLPLVWEALCGLLSHAAQSPRSRNSARRLQPGNNELWSGDQCWGPGKWEGLGNCCLHCFVFPLPVHSSPLHEISNPHDKKWNKLTETQKNNTLMKGKCLHRESMRSSTTV